MFDFAWSELALIAIIALVVIGPKDLPRVMRTVGMWVRRARAIASEFQGNLEQMVRDVELDEVRREVETATRFNFDEEIKKTIDPTGELHDAVADPLLHNPLAETPLAETPPALLPPPPAPAQAAWPAPSEPAAPHEAPADLTHHPVS